ncbi:MAG: hypothetical protein ACXWQR_12325 [Ktedonobacterales bacterium]
MRAVHIISLIARLALMAALLLGLLYWIFHISFINIHMWLGITGATGLLALGMAAIFTRGMRLLGVGSMVYAVILPVFGMTQTRILPGDLHWLIQTAHMLVGIGAMMVTLQVERRYQRRAKTNSSAGEPTARAIHAAR